MRWSPNKSHETKILRSPRQSCGSASNCGGRWHTCVLLLFQTRLVDHRSLVGGIGSSLGSASKAMKIKCETAQPPPWTPSRTTISARLNKLNSPLYSPLHVFVAQVQKVLGINILQFQISGGKKSALEPGGAHVTSDLTLPPKKSGNKVYL